MTASDSLGGTPGTPRRWACVVTVYGYPRDIPPAEDASPPDPGAASEPDLWPYPHASSREEPNGYQPLPPPGATGGYRGARRADDVAGDAAADTAAVPRPRVPVELAPAVTSAPGGPSVRLTPAGPAVADAAGSSESTAAQRRPDVASWTFEIILPDDDPSGEIVPWDRKPLMVALAAGVALILLAVLSGVASAAYFRPDRTQVNWERGGAPAPTPSASSAPAVPAPIADTITLSGVGDVIMGTEPHDLPPNDGAGFFDQVKAALASDLVMGNLETPLSADTGKVKCGTQAGCFQFYLPPSYANHLRDGGFQMLNLANNHTNDMGPVGLRNTESALDAVGIKHTGAPNQITYVTVKGVTVAVLGFSIYSWGANLNHIAAAKALVSQAAAKADLVVIQMQGGAEGSDRAHVHPGHEIFLGEDRGDLIAFSHAVIDAGADVIFGHGPHIMRGMEFYKGRLIAYSLGNFCGYGVLNSSGYLGVGGVLRVSLHKDGSWAGGTLVPTEMVRHGLPAPDPGRRALAFVNGLSTDDFGAAAAAIATADGAITPPA